MNALHNKFAGGLGILLHPECFVWVEKCSFPSYDNMLCCGWNVIPCVFHSGTDILTGTNCIPQFDTQLTDKLLPETDFELYQDTKLLLTMQTKHVKLLNTNVFAAG